MSGNSDNGGYHLSLSIGKSLWDDLVGSALPVRVGEGSFEVGKMVYNGLKQLQVKEKVVALLEDQQPDSALVKARERAADIWGSRRSQVYSFIQEIIRIEGDWQIEVDREGTEFRYDTQKLGVDAHVKAVVHGKAHLLKENLELPFTIEKRLGASCSLGNIRYDKQSRAIIGEVMNPEIDLGEHVIFRMLNDAAGKLIEQQGLSKINPVPILKKDQIDEMVAPAGGPLKMQMGVDDIQLEVTQEDLTLRIRFGFSQLQLTAAS